MIKSLKKQQGGFTLIELMVVIVIIGILVAIALPNFIGAQDRAKVASVKANMHTFQTALETYAVDWGGQYPDTVANAESQARQDGYWKEFTNPVDKAQASLIDDGSATDGAVAYDFVNATRYYIYGFGKEPTAADDYIKDKGQNFVLGNS